MPRSTSRALSIAWTSRSTGGPALVRSMTRRSAHASTSTNQERRVGCATGSKAAGAADATAAAEAEAEADAPGAPSAPGAPGDPGAPGVPVPGAPGAPGATEIAGVAGGASLAPSSGAQPTSLVTGAGSQ